MHAARRCVLESSASSELIVRLRAYPKMWAALEVLPPKVLALSSSEPSKPIELLDAAALETRVEDVTARIERATFTGKGDKPMVIAMYKDYVGSIATVLQKTLVLAAVDETPREEALAPMPTVAVPAAAPLRLAAGQLLLSLHDAGGRRDGGEGGATHLGVVGETGQSVALTLSGGDAQLAFDAFSQVVLPWRPPHAGWDAAALVEAPRGLAGRAQKLSEDARAPSSEQGLQALSEGADALVAAIAALPALVHIAGEAREAGDAVRRGVSAMLKRKDDGESRELATELEVQMSHVRAAIARLQPEALAVKALRSSGAIGARRYAAGQWLTVRRGLGKWADVEVGADGAVRLDDAALVLRPWNHAPRELPHSAFETVRMWYMDTLRAQHSHISDALSGKRLHVLEQCVPIDVQGEAELSGVHTGFDLGSWLAGLHTRCCLGSAVDGPAAALLTGPPAAGKTSLMSQVVMHLLMMRELVPIAIKVQRLQVRLLAAPDAFASSWNWIDAYLRVEHHEDGPLYLMLRQALVARRALILLDGLDEGGRVRAQIERHVTEVLAPQGHVLLVTSRPAGITEARFVDFRRLELAPLTEAQQQTVLEERLGATRAAELQSYVRDKVPRDTETGLRVTSNPLMLSMVASIAELRRGVGMPSTIAELYADASNAMLARGGAATAELHRLLQAIFFEAHVAQRRVIEDRQLDEAALGLDCPELLAEIREGDAKAPFEPFEGRAEIGHYVEVVKEGKHAGKRGVITKDDKTNLPYKVTFADGMTTDWLTPVQLKSSGLDKKAFLSESMAASADQLRDACSQLLPEATRNALSEVRRRVVGDELPLLSLLQAEPLQVQSSHLSFQEFFAAQALCEEGTVLAGEPPWRWPAWWSNALTIGVEMGEPFVKGLLRAAGVSGDALDLSKKLGGDRPTVLAVLCTC